MLTILFTAAGIVVAVLVVAAAKRFSDKREQQLRDDLADCARGVAHSGWVEVHPDFYTMPDGTVHPSAPATIINSEGRK
jgi:hypothetical protein